MIVLVIVLLVNYRKLVDIVLVLLLLLVLIVGYHPLSKIQSMFHVRLVEVVMQHQLNVEVLTLPVLQVVVQAAWIQPIF